jgi:NAD(P)H-hydrate epimerase
VLCGIIGSLLAQGMSAWDAAELGVYLHGDAGKIAAARYGTRAVIAEDIIQAIPEALMLYENAQIKGGAQC